MPRKEARPRRRLGRGLGSLVEVLPPGREPEPAAPSAPADTAPAVDSPAAPRELALASISPNPRQPRKQFDEPALESLAASIRSAGLMQPVVVRPVGGERFELVAGERRWRAAQLAGLESIPVIVREADDRQSAEWSLIENLQREDLNPIERAEAFLRLIEDHGLRHQDVAEVVGLDRSSITNHLRLLELESELRDLVREGMLGLSHARALLALASSRERLDVAARAVREEWSARAVEREVARRAGRGEAPTSPAPGRAPTPREAHLADLERRLSDHLGTRVRIRPGRKKGAGTLHIDFFDPGQFEGLMQRLGFELE